MVLLSVTGIGVFNTLQYWALEHTQALNTLLLQSSGPLIVAVWSLILLGVRLTLAQAIGVLLSLSGVLVILTQGELAVLSAIRFNKGDLIFLVAMITFGLYSVLTLKRPDIHSLSLVGFTFGCGAVVLIPLLIWELTTRPAMVFDAQNVLSLVYVAIFPSVLAYLCFNRGVQLIGPTAPRPSSMSCRYSVRRWQWCFSASSRNSFMSSALHWCWPAFISPRASRRPSADLRPRIWQLGRGTRPRSRRARRRMSCPAWQQFAPQSCFDKSFRDIWFLNCSPNRNTNPRCAGSPTSLICCSA
jgi:hypothetical protein